MVRLFETVDPVIEICDGKIRGVITKNHNGDHFYTFLGIPYGKAPLGDLRFKAPLPAEPWSGIRDTVKDGDPCYQLDLVTKSIMGSENCLYLNVFTRDISEYQPLKPVIFYIHGGAFIMGSGNSKMFSPTFLMTEDIVFVSCNYRVGILGFLCLNDTSLEVPGNAGLKDQVLALKWVQKNIRKFGGDPNNVTIVGTSAGSVSVNYHILSPASKGLFHRAILQSGTVFNPWTKILDSKSGDIAKYLKQRCTNEAEVLHVLKNIPIAELLRVQKQLQNTLVDKTTSPFVPTIEKPNDTAFLTRKPIDVITSGDYNHVPMLISYASNEGLYIELVPEESKRIQSELYIPQIILPDDKIKAKQLMEELRELYTSEKYKNNRHMAAGDCMFTSGIIGCIKNLARTCTQPIYVCKFDVVTSRNKLRKVMKVPENIPGAAHGDESGYLFESFIFKDCPIVPGTMEEITMRRSIKFWVNFAKYGNPAYDQEDKLLWQPVTKDTLHYLHFGKDLSVGINPEEDRMKVWKKIFNSHEDTKGYIP